MRGRIDDPVARDRLAKLIGHQDADIRFTAFESLVRQGEAAERRAIWVALQSKSFGKLERVLGRSVVGQDDELRAVALERLRQSGRLQLDEAELDVFFENTPAARRLELSKTLLQAHRQGEEVSESVACAALRALGNEKSEELVDVIAKSLSSRSSDVRGTAIAQLGRTFAVQAVPHLIDALKDDDINLRNAAGAALDAIRDYQERQEKWRRWMKKAKDDSDDK